MTLEIAKSYHSLLLLHEEMEMRRYVQGYTSNNSDWFGP